MNDKIKKLQISLKAAQDKLALAKKDNKTVAITVLTARISMLEKKSPDYRLEKNKAW